MKNILISTALVVGIVMIGFTGCKDDSNQINYQNGTFPDSIMNITGINSAYDDFNAALPQIGGSFPLMFSSNRNSSGDNFDIVTGLISFAFNQVTGGFAVGGDMFGGAFYSSLQSKVNSSTDQLGPYRFFNSLNGMEFFFYSNVNQSGDLDIMFMEYFPPTLYEVPIIPEPLEATRLNGASDDGYLSIDWEIENVYLTSDRSGDFDIYTSPIDRNKGLNSWLRDDAEVLVVADSVNSDYNDKCPFIFDEYMIFTSNRPDGFGGYDLYYSKFVNGKWGSPVNFGPRVNTEYNEYRPVMGLAVGYTNQFMIFSSDRPGGLGGYDLYFTGVTFDQ